MMQVENHLARLADCETRSDLASEIDRVVKFLSEIPAEKRTGFSRLPGASFEHGSETRIPVSQQERQAITKRLYDAIAGAAVRIRAAGGTAPKVPLANSDPWHGILVLQQWCQKSLQTPSGQPNPKETDMTGEARAMAVLIDHPDWTDAKIAKEASVHPKTLSRYQRYRAARDMMKETGRKALGERLQNGPRGQRGISGKR